MDWNALKLFYTVAQQRSLNKAGQELLISHTTVFRHLNAFETDIGVRLFERLKGEYELTEAGEWMYEKVQSISSHVNEIERRLVGFDQQLSGEVIVTAPSSFAYHFLPHYLAELHELQPSIKVTLLVTNEVLNMAERKSDIALRVTSSPPETLVGRKVRTIKWGVYASQEYLQKNEPPKSVEDLHIHKLISAIGHLQTSPGFSWIEKQRHLNINQRSNDLIAMAGLAMAGHGLAFLPDDLAQPGLQRCFDFSKAGENHLWILTHPDIRKVERIKIVMRFLGQRLAEEPGLCPANFE